MHRSISDLFFYLDPRANGLRQEYMMLLLQLLLNKPHLNILLSALLLLRHDLLLLL